MKSLTLIALSISLFSTHLFANSGNINPDTARAYEGHILTFLWPDGQSSEHINYKSVLSLQDIQHLRNTAESNNDSKQSEQTPFENIKKRLSNHVTIVASQKWTLIFREAGDVINKNFQSEQKKNGYPELTGNIKIKLGRYLESNIHYQHYLFDNLSQPFTEKNLENESNQPSFPILSDETEIKTFGPALVLKLDLSNKTASKKVNYLDHPKIGTLIYFEPIELEDAMAEIAAQSVTPETGKSLNYDSLRSTNELSSLAQ